jgi:SAM-dependent methyltransferase
VKANPYETERYLHEYLLFHYGRPKDLCPFEFIPGELSRFHERIREECLLPVPRSDHIRALDIGCAVGRFAFELSRLADEVVGIDNSKRFILTARKIAKQRGIGALIHNSGSEFSKRRLALPKGVRPSRVHFQVGDAQRLESIAKNPFQIVAAINLICRLPSPFAFLSQLPRFVSPGGQLVIASPFSWLKEYTSEREWLNPADLGRRLHPYFELVRRRDLPFVIREHRRKYQLVVSEVLTFKRC